MVDRTMARSRHLRQRRLQSVLLAGVVLALAPVAGSDAAVAAQPVRPIAWQTCPKMSGYLCGTLRVPLDYAAPSRGSLNLAVMERPVAPSKGVIVFNPGGPGESGDLILPILASLGDKLVSYPAC